MSEHYRYRKDKTHLSSTFRLSIDDYYYLKIYIWNSLEGMYANVLSGDDPKWESGEYLGCFLGMSCTKIDDQVYLPKFIGEIHLVLNNFGVGLVAHEITHFMFYWAEAQMEIDRPLDDEGCCLIAGNMNKKFWNAFYKRYELVDGVWE